MFIPYEQIMNFLGGFCSESLKKFLYEKKIEQNLNYIKKNVKKVKKRLQKKYKKEKIKVVFYVYDEAKWKCKSLYDLINSDNDFAVSVLVTKSAAKNKDNATYQSTEDVKRTFEYFKTRGYNTELAYDIKKDKFIPFEKFKPDIIIYQHPWYVETSQGPVVCSKFSLSWYVPYFVVNAGLKEDYYLRFHRYIFKHCVLNDEIAKYYQKNTDNKTKNFVATGHPCLDYFYLNPDTETEKKYVIYAPHWSHSDRGLKYGTFEKNGRLILEFAKKHPEIDWLFKPHPLLKKSITDVGLMSEKEVENYYSEWEKIGLCSFDGDYLKYFTLSKAMITDCGSFLTEYFLTGNPLIRILSGKSEEFCPHCKNITKNYYNAETNDELFNLIEKVIILNDDYMRPQRLEALKNSSLFNNYAAKNILDDIKKEITNA